MSTVLIRDAKLSDAPRLLEIYSYYVKNTAITFEYNVPSLEEFRHRMKNITLRYPYIVLEADGKVMGYAYAGSFIGRAAYDWSCELTAPPKSRASAERSTKPWSSASKIWAF